MRLGILVMILFPIHANPSLPSCQSYFKWIEGLLQLSDKTCIAYTALCVSTEKINGKEKQINSDK
jgi:hypothetical protein